MAKKSSSKDKKKKSTNEIEEAALAQKQSSTSGRGSSSAGNTASTGNTATATQGFSLVSVQPGLVSSIAATDPALTTSQASNPNSVQEIDPATLAEIITEQCDIENICSEDLIDNFNSDDEIEDENQEILNNSQILEADSIINPKAKTLEIDKTPIPSFKLLGALFGKKTSYINSSILGLTYQDFISSSPLEDRSVFIFDPYRGRLGSYWSLGPEGLKIEFLRNRKEIKEKSLLEYDSNPIIYKPNIEIDYEDDFKFGSVTETYLVRFKKDRFQDAKGNVSREMINSFALGGIYEGSIKEIGDNIKIEYPATFLLDNQFIDIHYDFYSAYTKKQLESVETPVNSLVYAVQPDYNFYIKSYENFIIEEEVEESHLPSLYVLSAKQKLKNPSPSINRIFSLDKKVRAGTIASITAKKESLDLDSVGQYFEEFAIAYPKTNNLFRETNFSKLKNIIFPIDRVKELTTSNEKKRMFPMYVDINFSTDKTSKFSGILKDTKMTDKIVAKIADRVEKDQFDEGSFLIEKRDIQRTSEISNFSEFVKTGASDVRFIELGEVLQEIRSEKIDLLNLDNAVVLSEYEEIEKTQTAAEKKFADAIYYAIFKSKMTDFLQQIFRTHDDILKGKTCYNETVLYRIAKYKGTQTSGKPLQSVYVPNSPDFDVVNYVDTQVRYDQEYTYVIYSYQLLVGNRYRYVDLEDGSISEQKKYTVENAPYLVLAEIPFATQQTRVYDSPPPPPEVDIVAYKDDPNKILLLLNSSANTYKDKPVIIERQDEAIFQRASEKQDIPFGQQIEFSSDDTISFYDIYRTEAMPERIQDFTGNLVRRIETDVSKKSIQQASSAAFVDNIVANKKYYYMFRSVDVHGKPSNPTSIYEVEMINENGTIFPLIKSVEIKEKENGTTKKAVKRFIQIVPSVLQTVLNEEEEKYQLSNSAEKAIQFAKLGISDNPVWGKKFKIRLLSKQTKKVVDFEVKFDFVTEKQKKKGK